MSQTAPIMKVTTKMPNLKKLAITSVCLTALTSGQAFAQVASPNVIISELNGQQVLQGDGGYDQIDYEGNSANYTFVLNADLSVSATKPNGTIDRLIDIDGLWFSGEQQWYSVDSLAVASTSGQTITGTAGTYDQVDYPGRASDYTFVRNSDVSVSVTKPDGSIDTLINIDGFWFSGEAQWYAIGTLVEPVSGNQTITGTAGYDQVDYPGAASDYTFTLNTDGSVDVAKPDGTTDTLIDIDGIWFQGEEAWYAIESLTPPSGRTINGTADYDQVDYEGNRTDYTFTRNADDSVTVIRPGGLIDTLNLIDGFWFLGEEAWYSIEDIFNASTGVLIDGIITGSNDVNDTLIGDAGDNEFFAGRGTDFIQGAGGTDTLRVDGDIFEWTYITNANGFLTMTHPTWGENTLTEVEQITSLRSGQSFSITDAIASTDGLPRFRLDNDNVINGTNGDDVIPSANGVQGFYGGLGDDTYQGTNDFEQVNYDGARTEYTITQNADGSITAAHPIWGTDTLINVDALIFTGIEPGVGGTRTAPFEFISVNDLFG